MCPRCNSCIGFLTWELSAFAYEHLEMRFQALSHSLKTDPTHKALVSNAELTTTSWGDGGESYMIWYSAIKTKIFTFSHQSSSLVLGLWVSFCLSETFSQAATEYLLFSFPEKFNSLLKVLVKGISWSILGLLLSLTLLFHISCGMRFPGPLISIPSRHMVPHLPPRSRDMTVLWAPD